MLLALLGGSNKILGYSLLFSLIHEIVHLAFILLLNPSEQTIRLWIFGAEIQSRKNKNTAFIKDVIINISAPAFNIFAGVFFCCLHIKNRENPNYLTICVINLFLGLFNMLPFYTFDGGNALYCFINLFTDTKKAENTLKITSVLTCVILFVTAVFLHYKGGNNYSLFIFVLYMLFILIFK